MNYRCQGCKELLRWHQIRWVYEGNNVCGKKSQLGYCLDCYAELVKEDLPEEKESKEEYPF